MTLPAVCETLNRFIHFEHEQIDSANHFYRTVSIIIMRPSSLGGGRILRRTLSVRLSVCLSVRPVLAYIRTDLRAHIQNRKNFGFRL